MKEHRTQEDMSISSCRWARECDNSVSNPSDVFMPTVLCKGLNKFLFIVKQEQNMPFDQDCKTFVNDFFLIPCL